MLWTSKAERNGVATSRSPGQVIDVGRDPGQAVGRGERVEQAGAEQGGVRVVDVARRRV